MKARRFKGGERVRVRVGGRGQGGQTRLGGRATDAEHKRSVVNF